MSDRKPFEKTIIYYNQGDPQEANRLDGGKRKKKLPPVPKAEKSSRPKQTTPKAGPKRMQTVWGQPPMVTREYTRLAFRNVDDEYGVGVIDVYGK